MGEAERRKFPGYRMIAHEEPLSRKLPLSAKAKATLQRLDSFYIYTTFRQKQGKDGSTLRIGEEFIPSNLLYSTLGGDTFLERASVAGRRCWFKSSQRREKRELTT